MSLATIWSKTTIPRIPLLASAAVLLFSCLAHFGMLERHLELITHFRVQYLVISGATALLAVCVRQWHSFSFAALAIVINAIAILPIYISADKHTAERDMRLVSLNVKFTNTNYQPVLHYLTKANADIILLQETTPAWTQALKALESSYPFRRFQFNRNTHGLAILSRVKMRLVESNNFDVAFIRAVVECNKRRLTILNTHASTPTRSDRFIYRNLELHALAQIVKQNQEPLILAGDLNTSMWSPYFKLLLNESQLHNAREGFGILPTFPTHNPIVSIPIDHFLISSRIAVEALSTGPNVGSDHLPILMDISLP